MDVKAELEGLVEKLVEAENHAAPAEAEPILSQKGFVGITRMDGEEQDRKGLLDRIENPRNAAVRRAVKVEHSWVSPELGVVQSIVTTTNPGDPNFTSGRFRNLHVFQKEGEEWRCLAWQVTKLQS